MPVEIFKKEKEISRRLRNIDLPWLRTRLVCCRLELFAFYHLLVTPLFPAQTWTTLLATTGWSRWWDTLALGSPDFPTLHHDQDAREHLRAQVALQDETVTDCLPEVRASWQLFGTDLRYRLWTMGVIAFNQGFLYRLSFLVLSALAWLWNPFLFSWHLLDIGLQNAILSNVLRSVFHNGRQLLFTMGFMACIVYVYTIVAFNFFRNFYRHDERPMCNNMLTCLVYNLNSGLRSGGGIGDELETASGTDLETWRIVYDMSFFFIVIVILLAIVQVSEKGLAASRRGGRC